MLKIMDGVLYICTTEHFAVTGYSNNYIQLEAIVVPKSIKSKGYNVIDQYTRSS